MLLNSVLLGADALLVSGIGDQVGEFSTVGLAIGVTGGVGGGDIVTASGLLIDLRFLITDLFLNVLALKQLTVKSFPKLTFELFLQYGTINLGEFNFAYLIACVNELEYDEGGL